ncbi:MAG: hypothetical protein NTX96_02065 [Candidatus Zambryskibacteria bacterium]|nr:hypothetical protein [Candidatus Zambryskibacteria bacterium]
MKKNIVQDVIPPKRTIRNVELLYKSKRLEKISPTKLEPEIPDIPSTPPTSDFSSIGLFVLASAFGISTFFKSAEIKIVPKSKVSVLDENFKALKDVSTSNGLGFQIVTTTKDVEKTVIATDEQKVDIKAKGVIVVYNKGSQPQKLIATTRFETPEGLIYRALTALTIPARTTVDGHVEVTVEADASGEKYNITQKDFTVPGFKGTPKYTQIYARSKTEMTGGFSGMQKIINKETINNIDKELEELLKTSLSKDIISQIPENFVLYQKSIFYKLEPTIQVNIPSGGDNTTNTAILRKKGSVSAVIFDKGSLSRAIVAKVLPDVVDDVIKITNLESLNFTFVPETSFDPNINTTLNFNLKGEANFVWVFNENKLKSELLGLSKKNAITIISTYDTIKEANIRTNPFWNQTIPQDPKKVTLINTLTL